LIKLIHEDGLKITRAAEIVGIRYPTAKAISNVFKRENRILKRVHYLSYKKNNKKLGIRKKNENSFGDQNE
jgi:hypothetical protein